MISSKDNLKKLKKAHTIQDGGHFRTSERWWFFLVNQALLTKVSGLIPENTFFGAKMTGLRIIVLYS